MTEYLTHFMVAAIAWLAGLAYGVYGRPEDIGHHMSEYEHNRLVEEEEFLEHYKEKTQ